MSSLPPARARLLATLQWIGAVVAVIFIIIGIVEVSTGNHSSSTWMNLVFWPLMLVLFAVNAVRFSRRP